MIDSGFGVWLIEVNNNPCLEQSCEYLDRLLQRMLDDMFKLTIDQMFPKIHKHCLKQPGFNNHNGLVNRLDKSVEGYSDGINLWEYLGSFNNQA